MHQVNKLDSKMFEGQHNFLGNLLLQPGVNYCDSNRSQMFSSHIEQATQVEEPQPPLFFTNFENEFSKYSSGYKRLEGNYKVLAKIEKNKFNYALIILNQDTGEYDVVFRKECEHLTEKYGYQYHNEVIDSVKKGDIISDEMLYRDNIRDEYGNLELGRNLNAVYLSYNGLTTEDAIIISKSTSEKLAQTFIKKVSVSLNTNDILINRYGNKKFYKSFPDIGEDINDILCSVRRINYQTAPIALSDMTKSFVNDTDFPMHGKIVDIEIICNCDDKEEVLNRTYNNQIRKYYYEQNNYYANFVGYCKKIIENSKNKISDDLFYYYNRYSMLLDEQNKFKIDGRLFDHIQMIFTVLDKQNLKVGNKLAGRYGKF